jgi:hypothetical protein
MSDDKTNDKTNDKSNVRWAITIGVIGLLAIALFLLPTFPRWLRVIAGVLAVLGFIWMLGVPPGLRATWRRWLAGLIMLFVVILAFVAFGPFPPPGFWRGGAGPAGAWGPRSVWSRPILSWVPDWLIPTTVGTVRHFTLTPNGELDGFILDDRTEVHVPPHLSAQLAATVRVGDSVRVRGYHAWFVPVIRTASITDIATGGMVIDVGPPPRGFRPPRSPVAPMQRISADGRLDMWLHGPAGDVNGAFLADGTILRFPPRLADQLEGYLVPGQPMRADGWGTATVYGTAIAVQTLGTTAASATAPPQPSGKSTTAPTVPR